MDGKHPYWSWTHVLASDIQTNSVTRLQQVRALENIHVSGANESDDLRSLPDGRRR